MKKRTALVVALILALILAVVLASWIIIANAGDREVVPEPTPSSDIALPSPQPLPEDKFSKDFEDGTPWWNAERASGEYTYAGTTMLAFTENGVYGYVFGQDKTLPPERSDTLYLGTSLDSSLYSTEGFEDMIRESNGVRYVIANGWIDLESIEFEVAGSEHGWIAANFSRVPLTIEYLRTEPWHSNLEAATGADIDDPWWDGKVVAQEYKINCPSGEVTGRLALEAGHKWIINETAVPEEMLLKDGCTIEG